MVPKYNVGLKTLNFMVTYSKTSERLLAKLIFLCNLKKIVTRYKKLGENMDNLRQTRSIVVNPIMVDNFTSLFKMRDGGSVLKLNGGYLLNLF